MSFTVALCLLGWVLGWWALGRPRRVDELGPVGPLPSLTIVVPARNEAASVGSLLGDLGADPALGAARIMVVDDHSVDATATIAASFDRVEVLTAPALPLGWAGKPWACDCGVTATAPDAGPGDVIVFLDADVRVRSGAVPRLVREHAAHGGLLSVQPRHEARRWYEQLSAVFNVVAMMGVGTGDPRGATGAFGPLLITSRDEYLAVGGHRSVRDQVVEDLALAARYRDAGRPLIVLDGGSQVRFRMYPEGLGQLVEGWTKNFAAGAGATPPLRLFAIIIWVTAAGSAAVSAIDVVRGALPATAAGVLYVLFAGQLFVMFRRVGRFRIMTSILFPIPLAFFLAVFVRSLWSTHVRRSVTWRGRSISTARSRS